MPNIEDKIQIDLVISGCENVLYYFDFYKPLYEIIKIDNIKNASVYISFSKSNNQEINYESEYNILCIFIIKIINDYSDYGFHRYYIIFGNYVPKLQI